MIEIVNENQRYTEIVTKIIKIGNSKGIIIDKTSLEYLKLDVRDLVKINLIKIDRDPEIIKKERKISEEHQWRIDILKRDNFTCQKCGNIGSSAHHIYSRYYCQENNCPELEWDLKNGITLCTDCHKKITKDSRKWFE